VLGRRCMHLYYGQCPPAERRNGADCGYEAHPGHRRGMSGIEGHGTVNGTLSQCGIVPFAGAPFASLVASILLRTAHRLCLPMPCRHNGHGSPAQEVPIEEINAVYECRPPPYRY
jgi:hypothetical protein